MNATRQLIATVVLAVVGAGSAIAQEATPDTWIDAATASKSRAQVQAELAQARKDGSVKAWSANYDFVGRTSSAKSRDQVRTEALAARDSGELAAINAEASGYLPQRSAVFAAK